MADDSPAVETDAVERETTATPGSITVVMFHVIEVVVIEVVECRYGPGSARVAPVSMRRAPEVDGPERIADRPPFAGLGIAEDRRRLMQ